MRTVYSYLRMLIAATLFMGGIALQFVPSTASVGRDMRWRERQLLAVPAEQHAQWIEQHDNEDARTEGSVRVFGVLLGAIGLSGALLEAAYLCALYTRDRR